MSCVLACGVLLASRAATAEGWTYYSGTQAGTRYSHLDQINRNNIENLKLAWTFRTGDAAKYGDALMKKESQENTPVLIEGSLITCSSLGPRS